MSKKEYKLSSDECKKTAKRQQDLARYEKNNPNRNRSLVEMAIEAREHGMTYGQYVAYLESKKNRKKR